MPLAFAKSASYAAKQLLDLASLHILTTGSSPTEMPVIDDNGIHLAAFDGDANGSQSYNAPDAICSRLATRSSRRCTTTSATRCRCLLHRRTPRSTSSMGSSQSPSKLLAITISDLRRGANNSDGWVAIGIDIWEVGAADPGASNLLQAQAPAVGGQGAGVNNEALAPIVAEAIARWTATDLTPA